MHRRIVGPNSRGERGAALIEFAMVAPLLIMLLVGIVEFSWLFAQNLNVRHGAREGARLVAVNYNPYGSSGTTQTSEIVSEICTRMDVVSTAEIGLTGGTEVGDPASATVSAQGETLTGLLDWAFPSNLTLTSTVEIRLEQIPSWANTGTPYACP